MKAEGEAAVLAVPNFTCYATDGDVPATGRPVRSASSSPSVFVREKTFEMDKHWLLDAVGCPVALL